MYQRPGTQIPSGQVQSAGQRVKCQPAALRQVIGQERSAEETGACPFHLVAAGCDSHGGVACELVGLGGIASCECFRLLGLFTGAIEGIMRGLASAHQTEAGHAERLCCGEVFRRYRDPFPRGFQLSFCFDEVLLARRQNLGVAALHAERQKRRRG